MLEKKLLTRVRTPIEKLWPYIIDTDRLNRIMGLSSVRYSPSPKGRLFRLAKTRLFGLLPLAWDEPPFEWVWGQYYSVSRRYHGGLTRRLDLSVSVLEEGATTALEIKALIEPRTRFLGWLAGWIVGSILKKMARAMDSFGPEIWNPSSSRADEKPISKINAQAMSKRLEALKESVPPKIRASLADHIRSASESDVIRMRPFELADRWGLERRSVLRAFLAATQAGLLTHRWEILCPNCRIGKARAAGLADMAATAHCETCDIRFDANFDQNVELCFSVAPEIRRVSERLFCIGGPGRSPHRLFQVLVEPCREKNVSIPMTQTSYCLRELGTDKRATVLPLANPSETIGSITAEWPDVGASALRFVPGNVEFLLKNSASKPVWLALEETAWSDQLVTAAVAAAIQEFRDWLPQEAPGLRAEFGVKSLSVITAGPILGSSPLSSEQKNEVAQALKVCGGSIVPQEPTLICAVFSSPAEAAEAACVIHEIAPAFAVGAHAGPVVVVNHGGALGFSGEAVKAARALHDTAAEGELRISQPIMEQGQGSFWRRMLAGTALPHAPGDFPAPTMVWSVRSPAGKRA